MCVASDGPVSFRICRVVRTDNVSVEITQDQFAAVKTARANLLVCLGIEEKLVLLLENYCEFEEELLSSALRSVVFDVTNWSEFMTHFGVFNRRLLNLLSACRLYLDHLKHDVTSIYGTDSEALGEIDKARHAAFANHIGYRVMEALRNYVQHRGLPVQSLTFSEKWHDLESGRVSRTTVVPYLNARRLAIDSKFNRKTLAELESLGTSVDLRPLVRQYIDGIGSIHSRLRELLTTDLEAWDRCFEWVHNEFRRAGGEDRAGLTVIAQPASGAATDRVHVVPDLVERRRWLERRTRHLQHFATHAVTNEVESSVPT